MSKSSVALDHQQLHFPVLSRDCPEPSRSRPLSLMEYAEFAQNCLASLTPEQIQRQQELRGLITHRFRLIEDG